MGCGASMDAMLAARRVGAAGHVHGVDLSADMLACAGANAAAAGLGHVSLHHAPAEALPLAGGSVDVVLARSRNARTTKPNMLVADMRALRPA